MTLAVVQLASLRPFCASHPQAAGTQPGCFPRQTSTFAEAADVFAVVLVICLDTPASLRKARPAQVSVVFRLFHDNQNRRRPSGRTLSTEPGAASASPARSTQGRPANCSRQGTSAAVVDRAFRFRRRRPRTGRPWVPAPRPFPRRHAPAAYSHVPRSRVASARPPTMT